MLFVIYLQVIRERKLLNKMNSSKLRSSNTWRGKDLLKNKSQNSTPSNAFPPSHSNLRKMKLKSSKILITNEQEVAEMDKHYEVLSWLTLTVRHLLYLVEIQSCCTLALYRTTRDQLLCNYWLKAFCQFASSCFYPLPLKLHYHPTPIT